MGKYDFRTNYEMLYKRLLIEVQMNHKFDFADISDYQLIVRIDNLLRKLNLEPFLPYEIDEISSNITKNLTVALITKN